MNVCVITKYGRKYTIDDLLDNILINRKNLLSIKIDGNNIVLQRNFEYSTRSELYRVYINGNILCNLCSKHKGLSKVLGVLNETYTSNS